MKKWGGVRDITVDKIKDSFPGPQSRLNTIVVPDNIINIDPYVFSSFPFITTVDFSGLYSRRFNYARIFCANTTIQRVVLPSNIGSVLKGYAFSGCVSLREMVIPDGVMSIGCRAFTGCISLTSVVFPSSLGHIGEEAFSGCVSLASVSMPSVFNADHRIFHGCVNLIHIKVGSYFTLFFIHEDDLHLEAIETVGALPTDQSYHGYVPEGTLCTTDYPIPKGLSWYFDRYVHRSIKISREIWDITHWTPSRVKRMSALQRSIFVTVLICGTRFDPRLPRELWFIIFTGVYR
jgi:hypothetical protein